MTTIASGLRNGDKCFWNSEAVTVIREARDVNDKLVVKTSKGLRLYVPGNVEVKIAE